MNNRYSLSLLQLWRHSLNHSRHAEYLAYPFQREKGALLFQRYPLIESNGSNDRLLEYHDALHFAESTLSSG